MSALNLWVEAFEFDAGIQGGKLPVHAFLGRIAPLFPLFGFLSERLHIWYPPIQALQGQGTELDLGDIEPTTMLGGMVDLQTRGQPTGLLGRKRLIERANPMRIEMITDQPETVCLRILGVQESAGPQWPSQWPSCARDTDGA